MTDLRARAKGDYRPDVDGLRAIAVLSVILFHIDKALLPGGFVGVDVFFVISGFLISRNLLSEIEGERFSLLEFYRRRVKRIAPALLVVVASTLVASQLLLLPEDARNAAKSAFWSLASFANVYWEQQWSSARLLLGTTTGSALIGGFLFGIAGPRRERLAPRSAHVPA